MGAATPIRPAELLHASDCPTLIRLFSETLKLADAAAADKPRSLMTPPGPFWLLANRNPSLDDMARLFHGDVPPGWPSWFERNLRDHALRAAFLHCLEASFDAGAVSAQDVCRVMAAVAQTVFSSNRAIVERNRKLAVLPEQVTVRVETPPEEWFDEELFISRRPDERGGCTSVDRLTAWMGSHMGPAYADKIENQDAVYAIPCGKGLAFALADGVSTSLGSRFAAALAAFRFCGALKELECGTPEPASALVAAVAATQRSMDSVLQRLLADPTCDAMAQIVSASRMPARTVHAVLENTRTAEKSSLMPALATTLIGGLILPSSVPGKFSASVICIGDGVVEKIPRDGEVERILVTDPEVSQISNSMSPGPMAAEFIRSGKLAPLSISLRGGEHLLVSSDGLARGHPGAVWAVIERLIGDIRPRLRRSRPDAVAALLSDLSDRAGALSESGRLFDDNLSLIMVSAG